MDIDIFFSDYIMANLMKIQGALMPAPEPTDEDTHDTGFPEKEKAKKSDEKLKREKAGRHIADEEIKEDPNESEDPEGEENIDGGDDEDINDTRSISAKSKSDVDNSPENQILKIDKNTPSKVDQRILVMFDKMTITLGEVVPLKVADDPEYEGIIDVERSEIPHVNILQLSLEGIEVEFNNGRQQNLNLIMNRLFIKDLQKIKKVVDGIEDGTKYMIPECYQMIMSNPEIEREFDEGSSYYTMTTKTFRTEDFKSIRDDEESVVARDHVANNMAQLKVSVKIAGPCTDVEFLFSNLRLIVTLPILERLSKFQYKIAKLQEDSSTEKEAQSKILQMINESDSEDSDDFEPKENKLKKTAQILLETQKKKKEGKVEEEKGYYERFKEQRNEYLMKGKKLKIKILNQLSRMSAKGKLSNFDIWIPLDSMNQYSRVLSLGLSSHVGYRASTHIRHKINEITSEIIESKLIKNQQDANVVITQLYLSMINRHLLEVQDELTSEKILLPSRIDLAYDKFVNTPKEVDITNIEMTIEPIDLKVGFRELDNFKKLGEVMGEFSARISAPPEEEHKLDLDEDKEGIEAFKETQQIGYDEKQLADALENEGVVQKQKIPIRERKVKEFIKMNVKLISESINLALMDDTGAHEYPLVNFSINKILASVNTETGEDDAANFILKKMGISQWPHLKVDAALLFEANYFNIDSGSYEPLIEPWTFNAMVLQKTLYSAQEIKLSSEEMLNLNLTYGMALAIKRIQTKIGQETDQWEDEKKTEETKRKTRSLSQKRSTNRGARNTTSRGTRDGEEDEEVAGFFFENHLGISMRITLENHDSWKEQGIQLNEADAETAVIMFQDWEESGDRNFRNLRELHNINKFIKKQQNDGKLVENFEENIIRYDLYIEGFEPITGVPIEIAGRRSYELYFTGQTEKQRKKEKYHFSITVDVSTEGNRKVVSFESQLSFVNKTEFDIEIAQVFSSTIRSDTAQLSQQQIDE